LFIMVPFQGKPGTNIGRPDSSANLTFPSVPGYCRRKRIPVA
jgi:hypothetical protein